MDGSNGQAHLGIDCGGTTCRVLWQSGPRRVDYVGAGANFTIDPDACAQAITAALEALSDKAGVGLGELCAARAYAGVAGIVTAAQADALGRALPLERLRIEDDRRAMVVGALGRGDGFVGSLGTGSFFVRRVGASLTGIGGWGLVLGDEASGAWLGRALLGYALRAHDGIEPRSHFASAVLDEIGGPAETVEFARHALPHEFARLAPGVAAAAEAGDSCGRALMRSGARWIMRGVTALGWSAGARLVLPGALGAAYVPHLPRDARRSVVAPEGSAVDGALWLAQGVVA